MSTQVCSREAPTRWTIGVCEGCQVQHQPHVKGCPYAGQKWFPVVLIEVERIAGDGE